MGCKRLTSSSCSSSSLSSTFCCSCPPLPQLHTHTHKTKGQGAGGCLGEQSAYPQDYCLLYAHTMSWIINLDMIFWWNCWELYSHLWNTIYCLNHGVIITNTQQKVYFAYFFPTYWNSEKLHLRLHNLIFKIK